MNPARAMDVVEVVGLVEGKDVFVVGYSVAK